MKILLAIVFIFSLASSQAVEVKFQKRAKDGTSVLKISGFIEHYQLLPNLIFKNKTRIVLSSPGGSPHGVERLAGWLIREISELKDPAELIIRKQCSSSCIVLLSILNDYARIGTLRLILDQDLVLGFHGCAEADSGKYVKDCTSYMAEVQLRHGMSHAWMMKNIELYARPYKNYFIPVPVTSPRLRGSGLINYGVIRKNTKKLISP
jgi:hypothetical protein